MKIPASHVHVDESIPQIEETIVRSLEGGRVELSAEGEVAGMGRGLEGGDEGEGVGGEGEGAEGVEERERELVSILTFCSLSDGKTFKKPRQPYEKERLDAHELKLVGEYGLRCKRELWRVQYAFSRMRNATRELLTLDEKNLKPIF
ncbi:uncharacterized protein A4U43_C07F35180 [Asparagus officinalis]|uniref:Ribosomal protein S4/S9 N-terminal domain-containing protein n=1 Tax=Asparagus officinalis TaxID=4686 RepID=A0A5P1EJ75_ASPOF|nr:uncharacterized protein A4U43_C07F35180 [Asparagus officinalis]